MNKINVLITRANGNLDSKVEIIEKAVKEAEQYVFPKLKIDWDIDEQNSLRKIVDAVIRAVYGIIISRLIFKIMPTE